MNKKGETKMIKSITAYNNPAFCATKKVLVAEDYSSIRKGIIDNLQYDVEENGDTLEPFEAENKAEAFEVLKKEKNLDLVITDGSLEQKNDGLEILNAAIKTVGSDKVIMYSGDDHRAEVTEKGATFVGKDEAFNKLLNIAAEKLYGENSPSQ